MATNIITQEDLEVFKNEFFNLFKTQLKQEFFEDLITFFESKDKNKIREIEGKRFLKSHQVERMLGISPGTLQNLRINGTVPFSKIGGTIFYDHEDIHKLMNGFKQNAINS
jgi:hypothetical protein